MSGPSTCMFVPVCSDTPFNQPHLEIRKEDNTLYASRGFNDPSLQFRFLIDRVIGSILRMVGPLKFCQNFFRKSNSSYRTKTNNVIALLTIPFFEEG